MTDNRLFCRAMAFILAMAVICSGIGISLRLLLDEAPAFQKCEAREASRQAA